MSVSVFKVNMKRTKTKIKTKRVTFLERKVTKLKYYNDYRKSVEELTSKLNSGLSIITKSHFKTSQKLWILHHLLIPRLQWSLLIYEIPMTHAICLERKISATMRKWLKLHHTTSNLCFYSKLSPCPLPMKSLTSILKASKISGHLLLRESKDPIVSSSVPSLKVGKWKVEESVNKAETELNFRKVLGIVQTGKAGLGNTKPIKEVSTRSHAYRQRVSSTAREIDEEENLVKALSLQVQGRWTAWVNYIQNSLL